jgi:uncharacterized protein (DUF362 family)
LHNNIILRKTYDNQSDINQSIKEIMNLMNYNFPDKINNVDIKPNLCYYWDYSTGYTTDPKIVKGIINFLKEKYGNNINIRIIESDATAMRTKHVFKMLGYEKIFKNTNIELFNLSDDEIIEKEIHISNNQIKLQVPKSLLNTDLFINIPKMKIMRDVYITCALKNIFGCIAKRRKITYHKYLNETIVGINTILHPHITIVDGIFALSSTPIKLNLLMGGENPFYIDWVASKIMGYEPSNIPFLKIARKENLGNPNEIKIIGEKINTFRSIFPKESTLLSKLSFNTLFYLLKIYAKLTGDIIPPVLEGI